MAKAPLAIRLGGGVNNASDPSELDAERGEVTQATGVVYTRGSDYCDWKSGRGVFDAATTVGNGAALGGIDYLEFSAPGADNQIVVRSGTAFYSATAGLTGTLTAELTGLTDNPTGLWKTFATSRYHMNDGVSRPWTHWYNASGNTAGYVTRLTGLQPVQFVPKVTPQTSSSGPGGTGVTLTAATTANGSGTKNFNERDKLVDGSTTTRASVSLSDDGANAILRAGTFTGTGAGARSDWIIQFTYESLIENDGRCVTKLEYTTNFQAGSPTWTQFELVSDTVAKHTVSKSLAGSSIDSADIGVRITITKKNNKGHAFCNAYDVRLTNQQGSGSLAATSGVQYWWTEYVDSEGIESTSGLAYVSDSTGSFSAASGVLVTAPPERANSNATHWNLYRTTDGGAYPTGTRVTSLSLVDENGNVSLPTSYMDTTDPATAASSVVYGVIIIAGISFERDVAPPIATVMETFQNMVVVAPVDKPATLRYSAPEYPESFPLCNVITLNSDRDDNVIALAKLGARLGVFMGTRCRRIDHLPTVTDPEFSVAPEDFAPDHGCESRNGICYATLPGANAEQIVYVARDGLRVTNLYTSERLTDAIDWRKTVDVTQLSLSNLVNNTSESRLEFQFVPADEFLEAQDLDATSALRMTMWLNYAETPLRISFDPLNYHDCCSMPFEGRDYTVILTTSGSTTVPGQTFVDEVGTTDYTYSFNASGHIPKRVQTMRFYGTENEFMRTRVTRVFVDHLTGSGNATLTLISGDDLRGTTKQKSRTVNNSATTKPYWYNQTGQWHQWLYTRDDAASSPQPLSGLAALVELQGDIV